MVLRLRGICSDTCQYLMVKHSSLAVCPRFVDPDSLACLCPLDADLTELFTLDQLLNV